MNKSALLTVIIIAITLAVLWPLLLIWSLNTLFALGIAYGFFEWLAALILIGVLAPLAEFQVKN